MLKSIAEVTPGLNIKADPPPYISTKGFSLEYPNPILDDYGESDLTHLTYFEEDTTNAGQHFESARKGMFKRDSITAKRHARIEHLSQRLLDITIFEEDFDFLKVSKYMLRRQELNKIELDGCDVTHEISLCLADVEISELERLRFRTKVLSMSGIQRGKYLHHREFEERWLLFQPGLNFLYGHNSLKTLLSRGGQYKKLEILNNAALEYCKAILWWTSLDELSKDGYVLYIGTMEGTTEQTQKTPTSTMESMNDGEMESFGELLKKLINGQSE